MLEKLPVHDFQKVFERCDVKVKLQRGCLKGRAAILLVHRLNVGGLHEGGKGEVDRQRRTNLSRQGVAVIVIKETH